MFQLVFDIHPCIATCFCILLIGAVVGRNYDLTNRVFCFACWNHVSPDPIAECNGKSGGFMTTIARLFEFTEYIM